MNKWIAMAVLALAAVVTCTGALTPVATVDVGAQVSGTIAELHADYNSLVHAGQVIARIDPALFQAKVAQTRGGRSQPSGR